MHTGVRCSEPCLVQLEGATVQASLVQKPITAREAIQQVQTAAGGSCRALSPQPCAVPAGLQSPAGSFLLLILASQQSLQAWLRCKQPSKHACLCESLALLPGHCQMEL